MKPETLEGLLTDYHLGELDSDTVELLDAYLETNSSAETRSREIEETIGATRDVMSNQGALYLPTPAFKHRSNLFAPFSRWKHWGIAAALVLGLGIGRWTLPKPETRSSDFVPIQYYDAPVVVKVANDDNRSFWSQTKKIQLAQGLRSRVAPSLRWQSPGKRPELVRSK
jgi:hypothetical protein